MLGSKHDEKQAKKYTTDRIFQPYQCDIAFCVESVIIKELRNSQQKAKPMLKASAKEGGSQAALPPNSNMDSHGTIAGKISPRKASTAKRLE